MQYAAPVKQFKIRNTTDDSYRVPTARFTRIGNCICYHYSVPKGTKNALEITQKYPDEMRPSVKYKGK